MKGLWRQIVTLGFHLLYNELAWLYDPVSWLSSRGQWRRWQHSIRPYLPAQGRILEVACGPGHLLIDLAEAGYRAYGLDRSPAMLRLARRRLDRQGQPVRLCQAEAAALPFAAWSFAAVAVTFPTAFVYDPAWLEQLARVLQPGGRAIVVEMAHFVRRDPHSRCLEWLYRVTGQRGPAPDLVQLLAAAGLPAQRQEIQIQDTQVGLLIADKPNHSD